MEVELRAAIPDMPGLEPGERGRILHRCRGIRGCAGRKIAAKVGGHLVGRFCFCGALSSATWRSNGNAGCFEIAASRFPPYAGLLLDAPQRPAQPTERQDLLSFLFVQDIAHSTESMAPPSSMSCCFYWPLLRYPPRHLAPTHEFAPSGVSNLWNCARASTSIFARACTIDRGMVVSSLSGYLCSYSDPLAETLARACRDAELGTGRLQPGPRLHGAGGERRRSLQSESSRR
jgi:hypothetical protein